MSEETAYIKVALRQRLARDPSLSEDGYTFGALDDIVEGGADTALVPAKSFERFEAIEDSRQRRRA